VTENPSPSERFTRTIDLYGEAGFASVRSANVLICGLGGVGAHAALALARSGVGALKLVDFDLVTMSSLNRNPVAAPADVDRPKAEVLAEHLARTCPDTRVTAVREFVHDDTLEALLTPAPDLVVDAIDSLNPKLALLAHCLSSGQAVVSSMGAAGRRDVAALRSGDLWNSRGCPLASRVRKFLRRRGVTAPLPCVWSEEPPAAALPPDLSDHTLERGRVRNRLPSAIAVPGTAGYALASLALERLARG
jgi:tRNA A37 threonylcarbamoyladenosine dehydratase